MSASEKLKHTRYDKWPWVQIVAVVEAAEKHIDAKWEEFAEFGHPEWGDMAPNSSISLHRISTALAALEEALS